MIIYCQDSVSGFIPFPEKLERLRQSFILCLISQNLLINQVYLNIKIIAVFKCKKNKLEQKTKIWV